MISASRETSASARIGKYKSSRKASIFLTRQTSRITTQSGGQAPTRRHRTRHSVRRPHRVQVLEVEGSSMFPHASFSSVSDIPFEKQKTVGAELRIRAFDFPQTGVMAVLGIIDLGS